MDAIRLTALAGDKKLGPFAIEPNSQIIIGRASVNGLRLEEEWAPRVLATLIPTEACWLVANGASARVDIRNSWANHQMPTESVIALPDGITDLHWPSINDHMWIKLNVGGPIDESVPRLTSEQSDARLLRARHVGTVWVPGLKPGVAILEPRQRHAMAYLFRHLLDGTPRPNNIFAVASTELGISVDALKKQAGRVRRRVNLMRFQKLRTIDELGEYLVERAQLVTLDDLAMPIAQHDRAKSD